MEKSLVELSINYSKIQTKKLCKHIKSIVKKCEINKDILITTINDNIK